MYYIYIYTVHSTHIDEVFNLPPRFWLFTQTVKALGPGAARATALAEGRADASSRGCLGPWLLSPSPSETNTPRGLHSARGHDDPLPNGVTK